MSFELEFNHPNSNLIKLINNLGISPNFKHKKILKIKNSSLPSSPKKIFKKQLNQRKNQIKSQSNIKKIINKISNQISLLQTRILKRFDIRKDLKNELKKLKKNSSTST